MSSRPELPTPDPDPLDEPLPTQALQAAETPEEPLDADAPGSELDDGWVRASPPPPQIEPEPEASPLAWAAPSPDPPPDDAPEAPEPPPSEWEEAPIDAPAPLPPGPLDPPSPPNEDADEAPGFDEDLSDWGAQGPALGEDDWAELEDEGQGLPPGRVLAGWKEFVHVIELGDLAMVAQLDTGRSRSEVHLEVSDRRPGSVQVEWQGKSIVLPVEDAEGTDQVRLQVGLGGAQRRLGFALVPAARSIAIVLGRDALEGYFVVDAALSFLHKRDPR